ncbi:Putative uncharacterized transposon-derived protein, partial [Frankliniella fusca]
MAPAANTHKAVLQVLQSAKPKLRKVILENSDRALIYAICEICDNLLRGNIPISESHKKMILVPHESVAKLNDPTPSTTETQLSALDNEMELIMRKKYADDSLKWKLYNETLQRYLHFKNESKKPVQISVNEFTGEAENVVRQQLAAAMPKTYKEAALRTYDYLSTSGSRVTWDSSGLVSLSGTPVANSNIIDLISDLTRSRKNFEPIMMALAIFCVSDVFSKFAWAVPIKDKSGPSIIKGFQTIFKTKDRRPTRLFSDKGKEYINKTFPKFLKENDITYIHTHNPDIKCSIVERWQRTIKSKLFKRFTHTEQYRYVDGLLDDIVDAYNHTYHRSIKMRPVDVTPDRVLEVYNNLYHGMKHTSKKTKFNVGDYVRISREKQVFEKGYTWNWSEEIFKIVQVIPHAVPVPEDLDKDPM